MILKKLIAALAGAASLAIAADAHAETLRLLTWGNYAPDDVIALFEKEYPDIDVEVTLSNNEEMIAKLRATGSFTKEDLANIRFAAQIQPGVEDLEGKTLERIKAAASN